MVEHPITIHADPRYIWAPEGLAGYTLEATADELLTLTPTTSVLINGETLATCVACERLDDGQYRLWVRQDVHPNHLISFSEMTCAKLPQVNIWLVVVPLRKANLIRRCKPGDVVMVNDFKVEILVIDAIDAKDTLDRVPKFIMSVKSEDTLDPTGIGHDNLGFDEDDYDPGNDPRSILD